MNENQLFAFIGVAAAGKTELARYLCQNFDFEYLPSTTTRPKREGNLSEYHHVSRAEFEELIENDEMLEYTTFNDHYYGKRKKHFYELIEKTNVAYVITPDRVKELKKIYPNAFVICVSPKEPMLDTIKSRLEKRTVHHDENILRKIKTVENDLNFIGQLLEENYIDATIVTVDEDHDSAINELKSLAKRIKA